MVQLLWIGCLESNDEFEIKAKKGYRLASAQVSQQNLLSGIEQVSGMQFDSINGSVLPPYPLYADKNIEQVEWNHAEGCADISVGYRNVKYINRINCRNAMLMAANKWVDKRYKNGELVVFAYSMRSASMATACRIKELIPKAKIYLIVTDLPHFMDLGQSRIKSILKKIDWRHIKKMQNRFDGFVLYASKMAEFLKIPDDKWILMEGSYDLNDCVEIIKPEELSPVPNKNHCKAIMYSGKLDKNYGIPILLDAFMQLSDEDAELWFTGGGNAEAYIKECASKDNRIKFYGFLPTRADVLKKQKAATLLVNMRLPSEPASAYCFPSKLFEYMTSGVPVLSFELEGIPPQYYQYIYSISSENVEEITSAIKNVLEQSNIVLKNKSIEAKAFVMNHKNKEAQTKRIWNFCWRNER